MKHTVSLALVFSYTVLTSVQLPALINSEFADKVDGTRMSISGHRLATDVVCGFFNYYT